MVDKACERYEDLFVLYPDDASDAEKKAIDAGNTDRVKFYRAVRYLLMNNFHFPAAIPPPPNVPTGANEANDLLHGLDDDEKAYFVSVAGILLANSLFDPLAGKREETLGPGDIRDKDDTKAPIRIAAAFNDATVAAVAEFTGERELYTKVFDTLRDEGTSGKGSSKVTAVYARQVAEVSSRLLEQGVSADDVQLRRKVLNALALAIGGTIEGRASQIDIADLDLEEGAQAEIIGANVKALSGIYVAAMLEDLKFFAVADKIAEQFSVGQVPVTRGAGGDQIYEYIKRAPDRMTEVERRSLYARTFGLAQGSVEEPLPNREFTDSWIRFLSAVSLASREDGKTGLRASVVGQQELKSGRDLAVNLSLHGYGMAHFAAVELQKLIRTVKQMLSAPDVLSSFGVKDCWQLTERISTLYLGGAVNSVRQRTMAQAGAKIINWLADHATALSAKTGTGGVKPHEDPDLVSQVESWLAVTGTGDDTVERFSEPVAIQSQRTIPDFSQTAMPDAMRDALAKMNTLTGAQLPQA
jgi:hypothetical protein